MLYKLHNFELLASCNDVHNIDCILDDLEVDNDIELRTNVLREFMGIDQSFSITDDEFTPEQEYNIAKRQLIIMNKNNF